MFLKNMLVWLLLECSFFVVSYLTFLVTVLLRYNSHTLQCTHLKCTIGGSHIHRIVWLSAQSVPTSPLAPALSKHWCAFCLFVCLGWTFYMNESRSVWSLATGFFHGACVLKAHPFIPSLWTNNVLLDWQATCRLPIHQWVDIWVVSPFGSREQGCHEHSCKSFCVTIRVHFSWVYHTSAWNCWVIG